MKKKLHKYGMDFKGKAKIFWQILKSFATI